MILLILFRDRSKASRFSNFVPFNVSYFVNEVFFLVVALFEPNYFLFIHRAISVDDKCFGLFARTSYILVVPKLSAKENKTKLRYHFLVKTYDYYLPLDQLDFILYFCQLLYQTLKFLQKIFRKNFGKFDKKYFKNEKQKKFTK